MNKIYKVIWSKTRNCYVAVSEIAKRNGKDRTSVTGGAAGSRQAARVLCALLLGAYLTAGYSMPVAWGTQVSTNEEGTRSRWGTYAVAEAENSTAWGVGESNKMLKASGIGSTAFGHSTNAIGDYSTAWGCGGVGFALRAVGDYSTAFGFATTAYSNGSTAWGNGAIAGNGTDKTKGEYATAWGGDTRAEGKYATSFGYATTASGEGATAWGGGDYDRRTVASGNYSTAFGTWTNAKSENSTAWGYRTIAGVDNTTGKYATAFGNQTTANTEGSTAWGNNTTAGDGTTSGTYATAWGYFAQATGAYSTAFGSYTKATGRGATAWGRGVNASETDAVVASGSESTAFGTATHAYGNGSTAWGFRTVAGVQGDGTGGEYSTAWGQYSQALGHYSTAFGGTTGDYKTIANAVNSLAALGGVTEEDAYDSAAIGKGAKTVKADTVALGGGSVANIASGVAGAYKPSDVASDKAHVWTSTRNAIAVGDAANSITRQITGVAAGSADTDAVNVAQLTAAVAGAGGGTAYTAGDGIAIDTSNNTISVKADSNDFEFDSSTKALKIKKNGAVASGNTGLVTGGTVFTEVRPSSDGTYVKKTSTTGANLTALDTQVKTNTDAIGNASSGLVKKVNDNTTAIGTKANAADVYTITAADAKFAAKSTTLAGYGITDAAMLNASNINVATWASKLGTGTVTSSSTNLITGKTVYTEVRPANDGTYVKTANTTAANLTALDTQVKANADALAGKADSTTVYSKSDMDTKLNAKADAGNVYTKAETDTKLNAKANTADVYTKTETDSTFAKKSDVYTKSDVDTKLNTKADKDSVYTKTETDTKLNTKADKDSVYTKTETDTKLNAKADASNVYTKSDVDTKLDTKADKTELATVKTAADTAKSTAETAKTTADAAKAAVDTIADTEKINTLVNDVDTLKKNEGGEVIPSGELADKNVSGGKVYNYLNKDSLELGAASTKVALGQGSKIKSGTKSVAVGFDNTVDGDQNIAIGTGHTVKGSNNIVIGDPDTIDGNDNGIFGNNVTVNGSNTFVIGHNVQTSASNAVVLGNESEGVEGAVSVGAKDKERQIKHVKAGQDDTDAVNVGQMNAAIDNAVGNNMINMSNQINKLDSRINKVGAGAAALAALHPLDMDGKFGLAAGFGNYRNANAMALGVFYRPTDRVMFSVGGSMGNGENMMNAGVSIALDKGVNTSKAAMARKIHAQDTEIQTLKAENAEIKEQNAKLAERLAAIEAKLGK